MTRPPLVVVKKRRVPLTEELVARVESLLAGGLAPKEVSHITGVSLATVYNVNARRTPVQRTPDPEPERVRHDPAESRRLLLAALLEPERPEPMGVARAVWGLRLACGEDCLRLDGHPVTFYGLMRRTNAALAADGLPVLAAFE